MATIKEEHDDSDQEEMEHDSGDFDKSSTASDTSDGSDTDDSSGLDGEECERRRNECLELLIQLERQFEVLKEQLYKEKITEIDTKLDEVHRGVAKEYTQPLQQLEENMRTRIEVAGILKNLRMASIENSFKAEEQAARQNFENEKVLLYDSLKDEIEERIRKLEEDRNRMDFNDMLTNEKTKSGKGGRGMWKRGKGAEAGRKKPVTVTGPYIVYMLREEEILEDWAIVKKAIADAERNSDL